MLRFDPGYLLADWPGAVNGALHTIGDTRRDGGLDVKIEARELSGRLRDRAVQGSAKALLHLPATGDAQMASQRIDGEGEVALTLGNSHIDAHGKIANTIEIDAKFSPLQLNDFLPSASGHVRGRLQVSGARTQPDIDVDLIGDSIRYSNYRAASLRAQGRLPWQSGKDGALSIEARGVDAGLAFDHLRMVAHGAVQSLNIEADADSAQGAFVLTGSAAQHNGQWQGVIQTLRFAPKTGAAWRLQTPARFAQGGTGNTHWQLTSTCFANENSNGGSLCASADFPTRVDVHGTQLPLALLGPYLPQREDRKQWLLSGTVDLDAQIHPRGAGWQGNAQLHSMTGGLTLTEGARKSSARELLGYRGLNITAQFDAQGIDATLDSALHPNGRVKARILSGWNADARLSGDIDIDTRELTWMELLSPDIVEPTGRLNGRITLAGTRAQPAFGGQAQLSEFRAEMPALGVSLRDGALRMDAQSDGSARIVGSVRSGDGTLRIDGALGWRGSAPLQLALRGENVLISDTRGLRAVINPDVTVRYSAGEPILVSGRIALPSAKIALERLSEGVSASPDVVVLDPVNPERSNKTALDLDLELAMGKDVRLNGFGLDGKLGGSVRMRARPGSESVATGTLDVDGRYTAYGQKLQITRGRLLWSNSPFANPLIDIRAERAVGNVTAGIDVTGRASAPDARVWSDPATSESEALAYLALGRPLSSANADESRQLSAATAALSASNLLASQLGAKIGLDDAGVSESRALGGTVIGIGKYLSPRLYVGYGVSLLGTGQVLTLKYLLRKGVDIEIESSTVENRGSLNWRKER